VSPLPLGEGAVEEEKKTVVSSSLNLKRRKKVNAVVDLSLTDQIEMPFTNKLIYSYKKGRCKFFKYLSILSTLKSLFSS
jgi:hypothetical protein